MTTPTEREAAYKIATDAYAEMVRKMAKVREVCGTGAYVNLPTGAQQGEHILAIARFLTEADDARD